MINADSRTTVRIGTSKINQVIDYSIVIEPGIHPCFNGISHAFEEDTAEADLVAGAEVLARAVTALG